MLCGDRATTCGRFVNCVVLEPVGVPFRVCDAPSSLFSGKFIPAGWARAFLLQANGEGGFTGCCGISCVAPSQMIMKCVRVAPQEVTDVKQPVGDLSLKNGATYHEMV